jgi:hypothetical protein
MVKKLVQEPAMGLHYRVENRKIPDVFYFKDWNLLHLKYYAPFKDTKKP